MGLNGIKQLSYGYSVTMLSTRGMQSSDGSVCKSITRKLCFECALIIDHDSDISSIRFAIKGINVCEYCKKTFKGEIRGDVCAELVTASIISAKRVYLNSAGYEIGSFCSYYGVGQTVYRVCVETFNPNAEYIEEVRAYSRQAAIENIQSAYEGKGFTFKKPLGYNNKEKK